MGKVLNGYYFYTPKKEYFFVTNQTKRTKEFCEKVLQALERDDCEYIVNGKYYGAFCVSSIHDKLDAATCEVKNSELGDYYDIKGENFGGAGSFVSDGKTKVIFV
jgi:hypothetical protein